LQTSGMTRVIPRASSPARDSMRSFHSFSLPPNEEGASPVVARCSDDKVEERVGEAADSTVPFSGSDDDTLGTGVASGEATMLALISKRACDNTGSGESFLKAKGWTCKKKRRGEEGRVRIGKRIGRSMLRVHGRAAEGQSGHRQGRMMNLRSDL